MKRLIPALLLLLPGVAAAEREQTLAAAQADELKPKALRADAAAPFANAGREAVNHAYALDPDAALAAPAAAEATSKSYWFRVRGQALNAGVALDTTAPGALVRLNALPRPGETALPESLLLDPAGLELAGKDGAHAGAAAFSQSLKGGGEPEDAGLLAAGTSAMRLNPARGAGRFTLRSRQALPADREFLVQVYEPDSPLVLAAKAGRDAYVLGDSLELAARLTEGGKALSLAGASGTLSAPDGRRYTLRFQRSGDGRVHARLPLGMAAADRAGLWDVEVAVAGPGRRNVRTAIALAAPTARLAGTARTERDAKTAQWRVRVPVDAAQAGRYELSAQIWGRAEDGSLKPAAQAASAAWLEGPGELTLKVEEALLAAGGLKPPYELRELRLADQSRLGLLQRQAEGFPLTD